MHCEWFVGFCFVSFGVDGSMFRFSSIDYSFCCLCSLDSSIFCLTTIQSIFLRKTVGWNAPNSLRKPHMHIMVIRLFHNHIAVPMHHPLFEIRFNQRIKICGCVCVCVCLTVSACIDHFGFSYPLFSGIAGFNSVHVITFQRDN